MQEVGCVPWAGFQGSQDIPGGRNRPQSILQATICMHSVSSFACPHLCLQEAKEQKAELSAQMETMKLEMMGNHYHSTGNSLFGEVSSTLVGIRVTLSR